MIHAYSARPSQLIDSRCGQQSADVRRHRNSSSSSIFLPVALAEIQESESFCVPQQEKFKQRPGDLCEESFVYIVTALCSQENENPVCAPNGWRLFLIARGARFFNAAKSLSLKYAASNKHYEFIAVRSNQGRKFYFLSRIFAKVNLCTFTENYIQSKPPQEIKKWMFLF